jgi:hypothetical protein
MFTGLEALLRSEKIECEVLGVTEATFKLLIHSVVNVLYAMARHVWLHSKRSTTFCGALKLNVNTAVCKVLISVSYSDISDFLQKLPPQ